MSSRFSISSMSSVSAPCLISFSSVPWSDRGPDLIFSFLISPFLVVVMVVGVRVVRLVFRSWISCSVVDLFPV